MSSKLYISAVCVCLTITSLGVNAALISRLDGQAYYDDVLDITWASDVIVTGDDTWFYQTAWAETLDIGGVTGWRLPNVDVNNDGNITYCRSNNDACLDNELEYQLFRNNITINNPGPFTNFNQSGIYVSSTEYALNPDWVWGLSISVTRGVGSYGAMSKDVGYFAWAVHDGDVASLSNVPAPPAAVLLVSGILTMFGLAKRRIL